MKKMHIFELLEHISNIQKSNLLRKFYPMKKSILSIAMAVMLVPQILISQDSMDISYDIALDYQAEISNVDIHTIKGDPQLRTLKTFKLLDQESSNNVKVVASFLEKETFVLHIYNEDGLSLYEESFQTDELNLAMGFSNLPKGKYFISLKTSEGELIKEFK
jgi:hypothetical protein